ncbi:MAG: amidase [Myxococcota bacterium]
MPSQDHAELHFADIASLSRQLREGTLSPVVLTQAFLDRIEAMDASLRSYATVLADEALEQARQAEEELIRGQWRGPLHGVPLGLKDLFFKKGAPTTGGMWIYRDFRPAYDATVVTRLREAGAVILGKLRLTEGAWTRDHPEFPTPLNPWDASRWVGASSSGPAVATASGLCTASLGSDTGGSIRFPCAMTRLTGIKPTWGRVSVYGAFGLAPSMDHVGPMTRSAEDAGHVLQAIAGPDPNDPMALVGPVPEFVVPEPNVEGLRIGLDEELAVSSVDPEVAGVIEAVAATMESAGAEICSVRLPPLGPVCDGFGSFCGAEAAVVHESTFPSRRDEYGPFLRDFLDRGRTVTGMEMARFERDRRALSGALAALFEHVDLLLVPVLVTTGRELTPEIDIAPEEVGSFTRFTTPFNASGNPTITMPGGCAADGTSIAFQFVAPTLAERRLVTAGRVFQSASDWHLAHPSGVGPNTEAPAT